MMSKKQRTDPLSKVVSEAVKTALAEHLPSLLPQAMASAGLLGAPFPSFPVAPDNRHIRDGMRFVGMSEMCERLGRSRTSILRAESMGTVPRRHKLKDGRKGWLQAEVDAWLCERTPLEPPDMKEPQHLSASRWVNR